MVSLVLWGCSFDSGSACDEDDDCGPGAACQNGQCSTDHANGTDMTDTGNADVAPQSDSDELDADSTGDVSSSSDVDEQEVSPSPDVDEAQDTEVDSNGSAEPDSDVESGEECHFEAPCDRGVDDVVAGPSRYVIEPEDNGEHFGCSEDGHSVIGIEPVSLSAQTCADDRHRYRVRARACTQQDYVIHIDVIPKSEICPIGDFADTAIRLNLGDDGECESVTDTECYRIHQQPEHGGHAWTVHLFNIFFPDPNFLIDFDLFPDDGFSIPYEVVVQAQEM